MDLADVAARCDESSGRRVVAIVLPELLCELAMAAFVPGLPLHGRKAPKERPSRKIPLGVLLVDEVEKKEASEEKAQDTSKRATIALSAVNAEAARFGVRAGQTVAEAHAFIAQLVVREVEREQVRTCLGKLAEVALGFGPLVSFEAPDTIWVDVTGASHLAGGEEALALDLSSRVRALGHAVRVAVSNGPRLAQAFARHGRLNREGIAVVPQAETAARIAALPVCALPLDPALSEWLVRLGVMTVGDLARLPRAATASRLGVDAGRLLDLAEGKDDSPLVAYVPPAMPKEETTWDDAAPGAEPLLFVLRGLTSRMSARLEGRGEAVQALDLTVLHDRSVARLEKVAELTTLHFELSAPLWRAEEMFRVMASRLDRTALPAPSVGLRLEARIITRALALQLHLSRYAAGLGGSAARGPETLPVVLAELVADLGKERVGILRLEGSHRPEKKSRLVPVTPEVLLPPKTRHRRQESPQMGPVRGAPFGWHGMPARLLPKPVPLDAALRPGVTLSVDNRLYSIERVAFESRLESVEWWTEQPVSRDYVRLWLQGKSSGLEALVYVDRNSGAKRIQALFD